MFLVMFLLFFCKVLLPVVACFAHFTPRFHLGSSRFWRCLCDSLYYTWSCDLVCSFFSTFPSGNFVILTVSFLFFANFNLMLLVVLPVFLRVSIWKARMFENGSVIFSKVLLAVVICFAYFFSTFPSGKFVILVMSL